MIYLMKLLYCVVVVCRRQVSCTHDRDIDACLPKTLEVHKGEWRNIDVPFDWRGWVVGPPIHIGRGKKVLLGGRGIGT